MSFPQTLNELETIRCALLGRSLARFGDGELRLALGPPAKQCKTQSHHPRLQQELQQMLRGDTAALICLPNLGRQVIPDYERNWKGFAEHHCWWDMISPAEYGSSFITRTDIVPEIDATWYWDEVKQLWNHKHVTLVIGDPQGGKNSSLVSGYMPRSIVKTVYGPPVDAYARIDEIERAILNTEPSLVILCLGATATCLAERLARRGTQALDLGHVGRFMRKQYR